MKLRLPSFALVFLAGSLLAASAGLAQPKPSGPVPPPPPTPVPVLAPSITPVPVLAPSITPVPAPPSAAKRTPAPPPNPKETPNKGLPSPPAFTNLTGIWEVQLQPGGATTYYSHLQLQQNADNTIVGYWELQNKKKLPFNGTFDGKQFKFTVMDGKKHETFAGYEDGYSDMVGLADLGDGKSPVAFTAAHRAKQNFMNNLQIGVPGAAGGGGAPAGGL